MNNNFEFFTDLAIDIRKNKERLGAKYNEYLLNLQTHQANIVYLKNLKRDLETDLKNGKTLKQKETRVRKQGEKRQFEVDFVEAVENNRAHSENVNNKRQKRDDDNNQKREVVNRFMKNKVIPKIRGKEQKRLENVLSSKMYVINIPKDIPKCLLSLENPPPFITEIRRFITIHAFPTIISIEDMVTKISDLYH